jgi:AAA domain
VPVQAPRIEIVGVAGSGKSTLVQTLCQRHPSCRVADILHTRVPAHWPYVVHGLPRLLPLLAASARHRPPLSWDEVKFVVYVSEWHRFLRARREYRSGVTVLDQGPIFALACLLWGRKPVTRRDSFRGWYDEMVERWSVELDAIVWLQAPEEVLLERINSRDQRHEAKGRTALEGLGLLDRHREAYAQLEASIVGLGRPTVLRFDTSTMSPLEIAGELGEIFEPGPGRTLTDVRSGLNVG